MSTGDNPYAASYSGQLSAAASYGAAAPAGGLVKDTTTASFAQDVLEESRHQPVLVDFWAPWCGPCKQLQPIIEKVVTEAAGRVKLVKLNIDDHPSIPGQLGIQSIPAVVAFDIADLRKLHARVVIVRVRGESRLERRRVAELARLLDLVELRQDRDDRRVAGNRFRQV